MFAISRRWALALVISIVVVVLVVVGYLFGLETLANVAQIAEFVLIGLAFSYLGWRQQQQEAKAEIHERKWQALTWAGSLIDGINYNALDDPQLADRAYNRLLIVGHAIDDGYLEQSLFLNLYAYDINNIITRRSMRKYLKRDHAGPARGLAETASRWKKENL